MVIHPSEIDQFQDNITKGGSQNSFEVDKILDYLTEKIRYIMNKLKGKEEVSASNAAKVLTHIQSLFD